VRAGCPKLARVAICVVFLLQILLIVMLFLTRESGLQLYFVIVGPIAFILFGARDRALRLGLTGASIIGYLVTEMVPAMGLLGPLPPSLYRAVALSNVPVVVLILLMIQNAFVQEIARREATLQLVARTDQLTGLPNRRALMESSEAMVSLSVRHAQPLSVVMIDIDLFKRINDALGHAAGDRTLIELAVAMRQAMRRGDTLGRFGGEEFVVLLPQTDGEAALSMAEKLRLRIAALRIALENGGQVQCTASLGVASLRPGETTIDPVLARADRALYQAKAGGRNRCVMADG